MTRPQPSPTSASSRSPLEPGDVIEGAVLLLKVGNAATDGSSLHRVISPGLSHWEAVGMTLDASDALRSAGWACEDDDL